MTDTPSNIGSGEHEADWSSAGIESDHADAWRYRGFSLAEALVWLETQWVFDPQIASEWRDAGFGPKEADRCADAHLTPAEAARRFRPPKSK
ncbi:MAG: hypothetical protein WAM97_17580 [Acidimicrobiales bacterium]